MGRPSKKEQLKKQTETAILKALDKKQTNEKYLVDQVDEYMKYFDNLDRINVELSRGLDIDLLKEKRQVTKEMRNILSFLGLKPSDLNGMEPFEEL
nr:MAG TPA: hypothetical protein [Caudoviricetes sp.]